LSRICSAVLLLLWTCSGVLHAEEPAVDYFDLSLEELSRTRITVTAAGYSQPSSSAPASVTTIYEEEWLRSGARTLMDVLTTVPGVHISSSQLVFASDTIVFRGIRNENNAGIKLLVDGEAVEYLYTGGIFFTFDKALTGLQRIEIIRGPGSALYGSDAFSGVINLITKDAGQANQLVVRASEDDTVDVGMAFGQTFAKEYDFSFSLDYRTSDDDPDRVINRDSQTAFDEAFSTNASRAPGPIDNRYEMLDTHMKLQTDKWRLSYWGWRNFDAGAGPGSAYALDPEAEIEIGSDLYTGAYIWDDLFLNSNLELCVGYQEHRQSMTLNLFPEGTVLPIGSDGNITAVPPFTETSFPDGFIGKPEIDTYRSYGHFTHIVDVGKHKLRTQVGYEEQEMHVREKKNFANGVLDGSQTVVDGTLVDVSDTRYAFSPDAGRHFYHASLQDDWHLSNQVQVMFGVRYDEYSDFGSTTNPRASISWQPTSRYLLKAMYGSAFRAPSFFNQFTQNNPVNLGNENLDAETIDTYELSGEVFITPDLSATLNLFSYQAKDLIDFVFDPSLGVSQAQNVEKLDGKGFEVGLSWYATRTLLLDLHHNYVSTEVDSGEKAPDVPAHRTVMSLDWEIMPDWYFSSSAVHVADRERAPSDPRSNIDDYTVVDAKIAYDFGGVELGLRVENLFDENGEEPSNGSIPDMPIPGRRAWLEARYDF